MRISWSKDQIPVEAPDNLPDRRRYSILSRKSDKSPAASRAVASSILIRDVDRRDSSLFTCRATNAFGSAELTLQLIVQGKRCLSIHWDHRHD